jgi:energy-coupling factor transporter ATP-binding protein EcfA2
MAYRFEAGSSAEAMVRRLAELGGRVQIIGPHGSGKSTLLTALGGELARARRAAWVCLLNDGQARMPRAWASQAQQAAAGTIVVDGYEQLSQWCRWRLKARCRREGWWLLVTAHDDVGLPTLAATRPSIELACALVEELLPEADGRIGRDVVDECFRAAGGNLREMLFALYDRLECTASSPSGTSV